MIIGEINMDISVKNLSVMLSEKGIRPSQQRIKIMEYLLKNKVHPTVEMIYNDLHEDIPTLSKTTVYNTLNLFIESDILRPLNIDGIESKYDIMLNNHGHFLCESCNNIYDFPIDIDSHLDKSLDEFKINERNVFFKGICPKCQ